jgi:hypothetical protein
MRTLTDRLVALVAELRELHDGLETPACWSPTPGVRWGGTTG